MKTTQKRRILIVGTGAIGAYVGGSLQLAGHELVFLATSATRSVLSADGLYLGLPDGTRHLEVEVHDSAPDAFRNGHFDLAVFAVKRFHTQAAADPLKPFADHVGTFLNLQNGVDAEDALRSRLGDINVIPGTVTTAVGRPARNRVLVERLRGIGLAGVDPAINDWCVQLDAAGLQTRHYQDAGAMKWSKLATNLTANPTSAILDLHPEHIFRHSGMFRLEMRQLREVFSVMVALGYKIVDLPGTPVRLLAFCSRRLPLPLAQRLLAPSLGKGRGDKMPYFHADLHGGNGLSEIGHYHGAVAEYGRRLGVATPVNAFLCETMTAMLEGRIPLDQYRGQPDPLLQSLEVRLESEKSTGP
jgi:2-dehydropantoate 2-reductase